MADVNNDGWLDIYVCNAGYQKGVGQEDEFFINNRQLGFADSAAAYGIDRKRLYHPCVLFRL